MYWYYNIDMLNKTKKYFFILLVVLLTTIISLYAIINFYNINEGIPFFILSICYLLVIPICILIEILLFLINIFRINKIKKDWLIIMINIFSIIILGIIEWILIITIANPLL